MRPLTKILTLAVLAVSLAACGSNNTGTATNGLGTAGYYNNGMNGGTNIPGGTAISFAGQGVAMNGAVILAGSLPGNSPHPGGYGQVSINGTGLGAVGQQYGAIQYQGKASQYGSLQLIVSPGNGVASITGQLQIAPQVVQAILASSQGGMYNQGYNQGYNPTYNQSGGLCIQSLGLDIAHTITQSGFNPNYYASGNYGSYQQGGVGTINQALVYLNMCDGRVIGPLQI